MKDQIYAFSRSNCDNENTLVTNSDELKIVKFQFKDRKAAWKRHTKFFKITIEEVSEREARLHEK